MPNTEDRQVQTDSSYTKSVEGEINKIFGEKLSSCCNAAIDKSHVITSGRHKGHGPRYCSKCGRCLFMV